MEFASPPCRVYDQLLLGSSSDQTRPDYQQIPHFVPIEIRRDTTFEISSFSMRDTDGDINLVTAAVRLGITHANAPTCVLCAPGSGGGVSQHH